jgi:multiple sugar transport system permease protein
MIPSITFIIPYFIVLRRLGLIDTRFGVIISHIGFNLPFTLLLMRSFFATIPRELEQAAIIDGCSSVGVIWRITLPLSAPGLATTAIFCLLYSWNEFLYALILTGAKTQTLPVIAASFITPIGIEWGQLFSQIVIVMSPMVVLGVLIRNHFVKGLTMGAVKG